MEPHHRDIKLATASSTLLQPNLASYSTFLERCSLPELTWFLDSLANQFDSLLARCHSTRSIALKDFLATRLGSSATVSINTQIPCLDLDEESYSPKHLGIDLENRALYFTSSDSSASYTNGNDITKQSSPLAAIAHFTAGLLATTLWDKSMKPQKHSRIRLINNTFTVLNGLYSRLSQKWSSGRKDGSDMLYAISVMQIVLLEKRRSDLQVEQSTVKTISVPSGDEVKAVPAGFLPIEALVTSKSKQYPESILISKDPHAGPNREETNGTTPSQSRANGAVANGLHDTVGSQHTEQNMEISQHSSVTLVVPCAGRSSRFPGVKPKWMLTQPSGALMVVDALGALDLANVDHIVVGLLKEHVDKYCGGDVHAILSAFEDGVPRLREIKISIVVIASETVDQVQTIECILAAANITGPIFLKDCDNQFASAVPALDGVATLDITRETEGSVSNVASKGYVSLNHQTKQLTSIVEKSIISNTFCIGGYAFLSATDFLARVATARHFQVLGNATAAQGAELAISDVIWLKMMDPMVKTTPFVSIPARNYEDWGTLPTWRAYCDSFQTLFVDIDGTLMTNSGQYFMPTWGTTKPLSANVAYLNQLHNTGRVRIILVTSRLERFRDKTVAQLRDNEVRYDQLLMGMLHAKRVVINDYAPTNPFPAATAVNIKRNAESLREMMGS